MKTNAIDICLCCDRNAVDGLIGVLASASRHLRPGFSLNAHIVDSGLGDELKAKVEDTVAKYLHNVSLDIVKLDSERLDTFPSADGLKHASKASYSRLLLHELFPLLDRVIYLDCDMLVRRDLVELHEINIGEKKIAAARDTDVLNLGSETESIREKVFGVDLSAYYFNAGLLIISLNHWRLTNISEHFYQMADTLRPKFGDQSILNVIFAGQFYELDPAWNKQVFLLQEFNFFPDCKKAVWHFIRNNKPWSFHEDGTRGIVSEWYSEIKRVGWALVAKPYIEVKASLVKDTLKRVMSTLKG